MGGLFSHGPGIWHWRGPPGHHSPYPTDVVHSPPIDYCFFDIMASYKIVDYRINLGPTAVTTNVDDYLTELQYCINSGYRVSAFCRIPGLTNTTIAQDWTLNTPYQVVLTKPRFTPLDTKCTLRVEKSILSPRTMHLDNSWGDNHLLNTIQRYASRGGRLVAACPIGHVASDTKNKQYGVAGLDLLFELPSERPKSGYIYHTIKIPGSYRVQLDTTQTIQRVICDADFHGQLSAYLNQGWRLVDICMDTSALPEVFRARSGVRYMDTVWIFEKQSDKLDDCTPQYEGAIIEYLHKIKNCGHSVELPVRDWRPVIAGMGELGWTLAAVVQTPVLVQKSFRRFTIKMLFIFQRPLHNVPNKNSSHNVNFHTVDTARRLTSQHGVVNQASPVSVSDTNESDSPRQVSPYLGSGQSSPEVASDLAELLSDNISEMDDSLPPLRIYENSIKDSPQTPESIKASPQTPESIKASPQPPEYNGHVDVVPPLYNGNSPAPPSYLQTLSNVS